MKNLILCIALLFPIIVMGQTSSTLEVSTSDTTSINVLPFTIVGEDTVPYVEYEEVDIAAIQKSMRLESRVRKVYPYAQIAVALHDQINLDLDTMTSEKDKRKYLREANKLVKVEFEDEMKNLSVRQGKILMKLIYRESGLTAYDLVKKFRGGATVTVWQTAAKVYGSSMKQEFHPELDPEGEDAEIEKYVSAIERGELTPIKRSPKTEAGQKALDNYNKRKKRKKNPQPNFEFTPISEN